MATNKERIISHNIRLETISAQLDTLPTQESCKTGQYVWKKYNTTTCTLLDYIQSDGTQYIDTGIIADSNTIIELTISDLVLPTSTDYAMMGSAWGNYSILYNSTSSIKWYASGGGNTTVSVSGKTNIKITSSSIKVNGTSTSIACSSTYPSNNIWVFNTGDNGAGTSYLGRFKLYSFKIYDGEILTRDFVPCITSKGEIGLFDKVNHKFYGNKGTSTFTAGNEIGTFKGEISNFVDFIISDNPDEYPDKSIHADGYYYESFDGEGKYIWKKYEYIPAVSDVTYTNISVSDYTLYITVNSNSYDLTKVNSSFFIGLECTIKQSSSSSSYLKFTITSKTEATQYNAYDGATTTCTYTYDASNKTLTIKPSGSTALSSYTSPYVSSFTFSTDVKESKILLGYVVSDSESDYPDSGTQDGYWYELVKEGAEGVHVFRGDYTSVGNTIISIDGMGANKPNYIRVSGTVTQVYNGVTYTWSGTEQNISSASITTTNSAGNTMTVTLNAVEGGLEVKPNWDHLTATITGLTFACIE